MSLPEGLEACTGDGGRLLRISQKVVLMHEDKTYAGRVYRVAFDPMGIRQGR